MPEITIHIGGRDFEVVCKDGEEPFLQSAAALLDTEAQALAGALGRIPESRMLLMAGLMLADKTASLEDQLAAANSESDVGPLAKDVSVEMVKLKNELKLATDNLEAAEKAATEKETELSETQANLTYALEAIDRMVVSLEEKGA
jgi:cell division protein ZapA